MQSNTHLLSDLADVLTRITEDAPDADDFYSRLYEGSRKYTENFRNTAKVEELINDYAAFLTDPEHEQGLKNAWQAQVEDIDEELEGLKEVYFKMYEERKTPEDSEEMTLRELTDRVNNLRQQRLVASAFARVGPPRKNTGPFRRRTPPPSVSDGAEESKGPDPPRPRQMPFWTGLVDGWMR